MTDKEGAENSEKLLTNETENVDEHEMEEKEMRYKENREKAQKKLKEKYDA